jgi:hypothetical protein
MPRLGQDVFVHVRHSTHWGRMWIVAARIHDSQQYSRLLTKGSCTTLFPFLLTICTACGATDCFRRDTRRQVSFKNHSRTQYTIKIYGGLPHWCMCYAWWWKCRTLRHILREWTLTRQHYFSTHCQTYMQAILHACVFHAHECVHMRTRLWSITRKVIQFMFQMCRTLVQHRVHRSICLRLSSRASMHVLSKIVSACVRARVCVCVCVCARARSGGFPAYTNDFFNETEWI